MTGFQISKFEINKGKINDTIKCSYKYNKKNQLVESNFLGKEYYSDFTELNLPKIIERDKTELDSLSGYRRELVYDSIGNIIEEKEYSKNEGQIIIDTYQFKYDQFNNVTEINRSSLPVVIYPVIVFGGRDQYQKENFRYVYKENNLWTEKYWIVENKEYLVMKRKFK